MGAIGSKATYSLELAVEPMKSTKKITVLRSGFVQYNFGKKKRSYLLTE